MPRWSVLLTLAQPADWRRLWRWRVSRRVKPATPLSIAADVTGRWALREHDHAPWRAVALTRWWRGPFWVTVTLAATNTLSEPAWTLTLWRSSVSASDWRTLNVLLRAARQPRAQTAVPA